MRTRLALLWSLPFLLPLLALDASPRPPASLREVLRSPDDRIAVSLETGPDGLRWSATRDGQALIAFSSAGLAVNGRALGRGAAHLRRGGGNATIEAVFYPRRHTVRDFYQEVSLTFDDDLT